MSAPSWDDLKRQRDGSLQPRIVGHRYDGATCTNCKSTDTRRIGFVWVCMACGINFVLLPPSSTEPPV